MSVHAEVDMLAAQIEGALSRFNGLPEEVKAGFRAGKVGESLRDASGHTVLLLEDLRKAEQKERADWAASGIGGG